MSVYTLRLELWSCMLSIMEQVVFTFLIVSVAMVVIRK